MKKLSAVLAVFLAVISTVSLFLLSSCASDPEKAAQKAMLKHGTFIYDYSDDDDSHNFKLTMNKDHTYSLYIRDYDNLSSENFAMKTFTGNWSHVFTYKYDYREYIHGSIFTTKKTDVLGIYLLEGYETKVGEDDSVQYHYFGYHKSKEKGNLFYANKNKTIDEEYLKSYRRTMNGFPSGSSFVELNGLYYVPEK